MAMIHLVMNDEGVQTAWFDEESAVQQCLKSNKEVEDLNEELPEEQRIPLYTVASVAIQDSTVLPYMAVYSAEGIIRKAVPRLNLQEAIAEMNEDLYDNFDHETDDARIFDSQGNEVYSFDHEAMYALLKKEDEENEACPVCGCDHDDGDCEAGEGDDSDDENF